MKFFFTLLFGSLFSLTLFAYDGSRLSITAVSNSTNLKIEVDGRKLNMRDNYITLNNINDGVHFIKIFREKKNAFGFAKRQESLFSGSVFVKRGFHTDITINRFGKVFVDECRIDMESDWDSNEGYDDGGWNNGNGNLNVMSTREFQQVQDQLRKEWLEKNRLISARVIMDKSNFTSAQVKDLMLMFTFEENKLEVAKYAFRKTVDKQNYYIVNDAFSYNTSKDELAKFMRESR